MESDFSPLESAISYKFLMFQKIPYRERLLTPCFCFTKVIWGIERVGSCKKIEILGIFKKI